MPYGLPVIQKFAVVDKVNYGRANVSSRLEIIWSLLKSASSKTKDIFAYERSKNNYL
jgi:hypothetical protein